MKTETKLAESVLTKQIIVEGKSESCSHSENRFYSELFNKKPFVKWTFANGIEKTLKDVFSDKYILNPANNNLPGIYNLEGDGRSVINYLNTNYTAFCFLLKVINKIILKTPNKRPINFLNKTDTELKKEVERFVRLINYHKFRIFNKDGSILHNLLRSLGKTYSSGSKTEQETAKVLKKYFGDQVEIKLIGESGSKKDAIQGIDIEIIKDDKVYTAQIKPFKHMIINEDGITLEGTANVKLYKTDLMIFQKGKNILIFNNKPKIVEGNFIFPHDSLMYNIQY